jgi:hypothetical protein
MSLLEKHKEYIEILRKEFYSVGVGDLCKLECMRPQREGLIFAFLEGEKKEMHVMDTINDLKIKL